MLRKPPIRRMTLPQIAAFARGLSAGWTDLERRQVEAVARKLEAARSHAEQLAALDDAVALSRVGVTRRQSLNRLRRVAAVAARPLERRRDVA